MTLFLFVPIGFTFPHILYHSKIVVLAMAGDDVGCYQQDVVGFSLDPVTRTSWAAQVQTAFCLMPLRPRFALLKPNARHGRTGRAAA